MTDTAILTRHYNAALAEALEVYAPDANPLHCSNCAKTRVSQDIGRVMVRCGAGHGQPCDLLRLIRLSHPVGWCAVAKCPGFEPAEEARP